MDTQHPFTVADLRARVAKASELSGWSINRIAKETGVIQSSLARFVKGSGITGKNIEKIMPLLFSLETTKSTEQHET